MIDFFPKNCKTLKNINIEIKEDEDQKKINVIQKEIDFVDNLIKKTDEKLKVFENSKEKNKFLVYEDICELNKVNNHDNFHLIGIINNNNNSIKLEFQNIEDPNKLYLKKKKDMEDEKIKYNKEYLDLCSYSKRLYVNSADSNSPLEIFLIEPKNQIQENIPENGNNHLSNIKNDLFEDKFIDIMKDNLDNHICLNDDNNFRKDSFNSELSFFDNSNINI